MDDQISVIWASPECFPGFTKANNKKVVASDSLAISSHLKNYPHPDLNAMALFEQPECSNFSNKGGEKC